MAAASGSASKRPRDFSVDRTRLDKEYIDAVAEFLETCGVPNAHFLEANYLSSGYTAKTFASRLRVFQPYQTPEQVDAVFSIGIRDRSFVSSRTITRNQFYDFLDYLRSDPGKAALRDMHVLEKLQRKWGPSFTAEEIGLLAINDVQKADYAKSRVEAVLSLDKDIAAARAALAVAERAKDAKLEELRLAFSPATTIPDVDNRTLTRLSWEAYISRCREDKVQPLAMSTKSVLEAVDTFGGDVRKRHMAMYIRIKRHKTTYFIQCDPIETTLNIKQKLETLIEQPVVDQRLILVGSGEVLEDSKTLADQKVENDAVVALTLRKDDNEFEEIDIVQPNDFYPSRDADSGNW